jgi:8-amino-7-oxononanoate synthase
MQPFNSQIIPLHIGNNTKAVNLSKMLFKKYGVLAPAIRPPTVPAGTARLRLTVTLGHSNKELLYTVGAIAKSANELNIL